MRCTILLACSVILALPSVRLEGALISVGTHDLLPNTAGQLITLPISGGEQLGALEFDVEIQGTTPSPTFQNVDIVGPGTIFDGNNLGQTDNLVTGSYWSASTMAAASTPPVFANGLLAVITIDTTGTFSGFWPLNASATMFDSAGISIDLIINDGSLRIQGTSPQVPEPGSVAIWAGLSGLGITVSRWRRRTSR